MFTNNVYPKKTLDFSNIIDNIFVIESVATYFDNIYDLLTLFYINSSTKKHFKLMFHPLLKLIIKNNLDKILKIKLNLSFNKFENEILKKLGLTLSGSTMLLAICGKEWGHHNNIFTKYNHLISFSNIELNRRIYHTYSPNTKYNINFNLYVNTSLLQTNKLSNVLKAQSILYDYDFPNDDILINYFEYTYIKYLTMFFSNNNNNLIKEYHEILNIYRISQIKIDLIINCFDFIYLNFKILETFHTEYYTQLHNSELCSSLFTEGNGLLILKLYKYDFKGLKIFINISMDLNWINKINNFDFDFLKSYWTTNNENLSKSFFYNKSLFSIINCNYNNYNKFYVHQSAHYLNHLAIKCNVKYPIILAIPTISAQKFHSLGMLYMWQSFLRKLKYYFRGFFCITFTITEEEFLKKIIQTILSINNTYNFSIKTDIRSNMFLKQCYYYYKKTEFKEFKNSFFWSKLKIDFNEHENKIFDIDLINDIYINEND
jgi:hypothetical protein